MFLHQLFPTPFEGKVSLNVVCSPRVGQENGAVSCPATPCVTSLFVSHIWVFPLQARFPSVLMSWKKEIRREKQK